MGILIDEAKCIGCGLCQIACPYDAIEVYVLARVDNAKCTDCTACVDYCPTDAIAMEVPPPVRVGPPPEDTNFDAVVIGAGVGGLCSAALLAHRGYKTLLVERRPSVGGRWGSLRHDGIDMPTGAYAIEIGGILERTFREVGAEFDVIEPSPPNVYCYKGQIIDPGDGRGRLRRTLQALTTDPEEADRVLEALRKAMTGQEVPAPDVTLKQWLDSLTENEGIKGVFFGLGRATLGDETVPAVTFLQWLGNVRPTSYAYSRRASINMPKGLAKAVTKKGGQVWTRTRVKKILMQEGRATGVVVQRQGREITVNTTVIVSDIGPKETGRLAGYENLPPEYVEYLESKEKGLAHIDVYIRSKEPLFKVPSIVFPVGTRRLCTMLTPTHIVKWGPEGTHLTIAEGVAKTHDLAKETEEVVREIDDVLPGWRQQGKIVLVIINQGEAFQEPTESPVPNIFYVGEKVKPQESVPGLPQGAETAWRAVALIQERFPLRLDSAVASSSP